MRCSVPETVVNTKRNGPLAKAINHLSGRVDRLEQRDGVAPQSSRSADNQEAQQLIEALKRGTEKVDQIHKVVKTLARTVTDLDARVEQVESAKPRTIELRAPKGDTRKID